MRYFVTGASGFVGRHLVPVLARHAEVEVLHRPGLAVPAHLRGLRIHRGDLLRPRTLAPAARADVVFHLAAQASPRQAESDPQQALTTNAVGTLNVAQSMRSGSRLILMSTGQVYRPSARPLTEASPVSPASAYTLSKLASELAAQHSAERRGIESVVVRAFNMYGPGQAPEYIVPTILAQVQGSSAVRVRSMRPIRDFTFIEDAVRFLVKAATAPAAKGRTLNLASGSSTSIRQLAVAAIAAAGRRLPLEETAADASTRDVVRVDPRLARRILGWRPRIELTEGLRRTLLALERTRRRP